MIIYKSYRFHDQDPIVGKWRAIMDKEAAARGVKISKLMGTISKESRVSRTTLDNWRSRKTKRPQAASLNAALRVLDYQLDIVRKR